MSAFRSRPSLPARRLCAALLSLSFLMLSIAPALGALAAFDELDASDTPPHLLISELATGGASASDEFVELYNPADTPLPLEGLELVYVSASGTTVSRKATWPAGSAELGPGAHLLIANEAGLFATVADVTYANGLAATGGSVALRIVGATSAIDAVGWGNATSTWVEGTAAPAPAPGSSIERLPGGSSGSSLDTDDNLVDFVVREVPDPQNTTSVPTPPSPPATSPTGTGTPSGTPTPSFTPSPTQAGTPTPTPTATPTPTSTPSPMTVAEARALPDGAAAIVAGIALTDSAFTEGGGYLADTTGGIAILLSSGTFARGQALLVQGTVDDRYSQRTVRASASDVTVLGIGAEPAPIRAATASIGEAVEGRLVEVEGLIVSSATILSAGVAFDVDDGSGPVRVLLNGPAGIDADGWQRGAAVHLLGVVGQRDSGGTAALGYRVQPRDANDILELAPPLPTATPTASPTPSPTSTSSASPTPTPAPTIGNVPLLTIAEVRDMPKNASVRLRGVVTLERDLVEPGSAIVQDATAAILVRLSDEVGPLLRGELVDLVGRMTTNSGMLAVRVTSAPQRLGTAAQPEAVREATGRLGEQLEARLVVARGALTENPRRSSAGNISFGIDDGSGEVRVHISRQASIDVADLHSGDWIEVRGPLGQETSGAQPERGYRIWPRDASDLGVLATAPAGGSTAGAKGSNPSKPGAAGGTTRATTSSSGTATSHDSRPPNASSSVVAALRLPALARSASDRSTTPGSSPMATTVGSVRAAAGSERTPLRALGLIVVALAALLAVALIGWRSGAVARLSSLLNLAPSEPPALDASGPEHERLAQLTVIRAPSEQTGP